MPRESYMLACVVCSQNNLLIKRDRINALLLIFTMFTRGHIIMFTHELVYRNHFLQRLPKQPVKMINADRRTSVENSSREIFASNAENIPLRKVLYLFSPIVVTNWLNSQREISASRVIPLITRHYKFRTKFAGRKSGREGGRKGGII